MTITTIIFGTLIININSNTNKAAKASTGVRNKTESVEVNNKENGVHQHDDMLHLVRVPVDGTRVGVLGVFLNACRVFREYMGTYEFKLTRIISSVSSMDSTSSCIEVY